MSINYVHMTDPHYFDTTGIYTNPWYTNSLDSLNYTWLDGSTIAVFVSGSDENNIKVSFDERSKQLTVDASPEVGRVLHEVIDLSGKVNISADISCSVSKGLLVIKIKSSTFSNVFTIPVKKE